jgi:DNA-binding CsgD family transcriptional regulator
MAVQPPGAEFSVAVLLLPGFLAAALVTGLGTVGWQIGDGANLSLYSRVVVAVDEGQSLPVREINPRSVSQLVLVGGIDRLDVLADTAVTLGASAVVNADLPFGELIRRVDIALRDGYATPQGRQRLYARLRERQAESQRFSRLTNREAQVLADLACGRSAAEIAALHHVTLPTVRSQIAGILKKLEVGSQTTALSLMHRSCRDHRILKSMHSHYSF